MSATGKREKAGLFVPTRVLVNSTDGTGAPDGSLKVLVVIIVVVEIIVLAGCSFFSSSGTGSSVLKHIPRRGSVSSSSSVLNTIPCRGSIATAG